MLQWGMRKQRTTKWGSTVAERLTNHSLRDSNGCLLWQGSRDTGGYGNIWVPDAGKVVKAHRAAWELANGSVPEGLCVCHTCDVRHCIELSHLWLGTYADNNQDCIVKGRFVGYAGWNKGRPHSAETRAKISARAKARRREPHLAETRAKMAIARKAWWERRRQPMT